MAENSHSKKLTLIATAMCCLVAVANAATKTPPPPPKPPSPPPPPPQEIYVNASLVPDLKGLCFACTAPSVNYFYCPTDGNCYNNLTLDSLNNTLFLPCQNAILMNQTDQCFQLPEFYTDVCDEIFFYGSTRQRWEIYEQTVVMPAQKGCFFKYNGTRSFIQLEYFGATITYFASSDVPSFYLDPTDLEGTS